MSTAPAIATRMKTTPLRYPKTRRNQDITVLTSMPAGKMVPIYACRLLREDSAALKATVSFQMEETVDILLNPITVRVTAYLVPDLAKERFQSMDDLNRSMKGVPPREGLPVVPYIERIPHLGESDLIMKYLGKHAKAGSQINSDYHEAYNTIWNFRAKNRSPSITERPRLQRADLAPAFWAHERFAHIVPDFDQAIIDGEVALSFVNPKLRVQGLGFAESMTPTAPVRSTHTGGTDTVGNYRQAVVNMIAPGGSPAAYPRVWAEMAEAGATISLANLELAKKTQAFAELRREYNGIDDEYIMDMLMDGLTIPEQAWTQPILLSDQTTIFGMQKRYATDGDSLTESATNGATMVNVSLRVPQVACGGTIMIVAEAVPAQLFERSADPWLSAVTAEDLPEALKDTLDPEKVEVVRNDQIDVDHASPAATFGYAPLNWKWSHSTPGIGGKFYRPAVDAPFDEDRQRIWAVETKNPVLSEDFYIVRSIHTKPFLIQGNRDPFEAMARGATVIRGITQFGHALVEATGDYDAVMEKAPVDRIQK